MVDLYNKEKNYCGSQFFLCFYSCYNNQLLQDNEDKYELSVTYVIDEEDDFYANDGDWTVYWVEDDYLYDWDVDEICSLG